MTDFEPYVADPSEAPPGRRSARAQGVAATLAVTLVALALLFLWLHGRGTQDPSLTVPPPTAGPSAPPADPGAQAPPAEGAPAEAPAP